MSTEPADSDAAASKSPPAVRKVPKRARQLHLLLAIGAVVFVLDLVSKLIVVATLSDRAPVKLLGGLVYLTEARNTGAAFGMAQGMTVILTLIAAGVVIVILRTAPRLRSVGWAWALGLVVGGALGNLMDRIFRSPGVFRGGVVDFISILEPSRQFYPIFNIADSAIVCGGIFGVVLAMRGIGLDGRRTQH